jgi:hypothetical protein
MVIALMGQRLDEDMRSGEAKRVFTTSAVPEMAWVTNDGGEVDIVALSASILRGDLETKIERDELTVFGCRRRQCLEVSRSVLANGRL